MQQTLDSDIAIVRNIKTNDIYQYKGENIFVNLRTGVSGFVPTEKAQAAFRINIPLTEMINNNPEILSLITKLKLIIKP